MTRYISARVWTLPENQHYAEAAYLNIDERNLEGLINRLIHSAKSQDDISRARNIAKKYNLGFISFQRSVPKVVIARLPAIDTEVLKFHGTPRQLRALFDYMVTTNSQTAG